MNTKQKIIPLFLILFIAGVTITVAITLNPFSSNQNQPEGTYTEKAVIVDQLNLTYPNQTFVTEATSILENSGYEVDYISGENVTIDLYRELPQEGYDLIIFRVHSAASKYGDNPVVLFTSQNYTQDEYQFAQVTDTVQRVYYNYGEEYYFAISPKFVRGLSGDFNDATIIHMGCEGLEQDNMAKAFVEKGARLFVGWTGDVNAYHSDSATIYFLEQYVGEELTVERSRIYTSAERGSDPVYHSELWYYPEEAGYKRISN